jgi:hypothetical protein
MFPFRFCWSIPCWHLRKPRPEIVTARLATASHGLTVAVHAGDIIVRHRREQLRSTRRPLPIADSRAGSGYVDYALAGGTSVILSRHGQFRHQTVVAFGFCVLLADTRPAAVGSLEPQETMVSRFAPEVPNNQWSPHG